MTRRSTGREGRMKGSKVTVFHSEGFHATVARTTSTTAGRFASCRSSPYCFRRFFFFRGGGGKDFIHLIINRIMNFMHVKITHKGNTWSQCNPNKSSVLLLWYEQFRKNPTFRYSVSVFGEPTFTYQSFLTFPRGLCNGTHRTGVKVLLLIKPTVCSIPPPNSNCSIIAY